MLLNNYSTDLFKIAFSHCRIREKFIYLGSLWNRLSYFLVFCAVCQLLLDVGVPAQDESDRSAVPLIAAATEGHADVVGHLLDAGMIQKYFNTLQVVPR